MKQKHRALGLVMLLATSGCKQTQEADPRTSEPGAATSSPKPELAQEEAAQAAQAAQAAAIAEAPTQPLTPRPGTLRLVKDFETEPLKSEQRDLDAFAAHLKKKEGPEVDAGPRTDEESAYLASYRKHAHEPEQLPDLPHAWGGFETVVVLSMRAPVGEEGSRRSGRSSGRLLYHPPQKTPAYSVQYGDKWGTSLDGSQLARWVLEDLAIRAEDTTSTNEEGK